MTKTGQILAAISEIINKHGKEYSGTKFLYIKGIKFSSALFPRGERLIQIETATDDLWPIGMVSKDEFDRLQGTTPLSLAELAGLHKDLIRQLWIKNTNHIELIL